MPTVLDTVRNRSKLIQKMRQERRASEDIYEQNIPKRLGKRRGKHSHAEEELMEIYKE